MSIKNGAKQWLSDEQRALRDLQLFFLCKLYGNKSRLVFKGGTALGLFYGSDRFSEDLDFDCSDLDGLAEIDEAINAIGKESRYAVFNDWVREREMHKSFTRYVLRVSSRDFGGLLDLAVDYTVDTPKYKPSMLPLKCGKLLVNASVMQEREILAEKVAAIMGREKARDLYDLYFLAVVRAVPVNMMDVYDKCRKGFAGKKTGYSFPSFRERVMALKPRWNDLKPFRADNNAYTFEDVAGRLLDIFRSL